MRVCADAVCHFMHFLQFVGRRYHLDCMDSRDLCAFISSFKPWNFFSSTPTLSLSPHPHQIHWIGKNFTHIKSLSAQFYFTTSPGFFLSHVAQLRKLILNNLWTLSDSMVIFLSISLSVYWLVGLLVCLFVCYCERNLHESILIAN